MTRLRAGICPLGCALALIGLALIGLALPLAAYAQDAAPAADGSASGSQLRQFCTDRPTKSNGACIVDEGHFQVESDLANVTHDSQDGVDTDTYLFTSPTLKYGLTHDIDLEVNWTPYEAVHTYGRAVRTPRVAYGVGDLELRAKVGLAGQDGGTVAATLLPYLKVPTAPSDIGDGAVEGGLIVPIVITLNDKLSLTFNPELDALKDSTGDGRHVNMQQLASVSYELPAKVTVFGEFWSDVDFDPTDATTQYSADLAAAWVLPHDVQLDGGVNIGLNRQTPAVQGYFGVSHRF